MRHVLDRRQQQPGRDAERDEQHAAPVAPPRRRRSRRRPAAIASVAASVTGSPASAWHATISREQRRRARAAALEHALQRPEDVRHRRHRPRQVRKVRRRDDRARTRRTRWRRTPTAGGADLAPEEEVHPERAQRNRQRDPDVVGDDFGQQQADRAATAGGTAGRARRSPRAGRSRDTDPRAGTIRTRRCRGERGTASGTRSPDRARRRSSTA